MKDIIFAGIGNSLYSSINHLADRVHAKLDYLISKDMLGSTLSLKLTDDDLSMLLEIQSTPDAKTQNIRKILSDDHIIKGRLHLSIDEGQQILETASLLA